MTRGQWVLIKAGLILGSLWGVVWVVMAVAGVYETTPEKVVAFLEERPISGLEDPEERRKWIKKVAGMVNKLDFKQRRDYRQRAREREDGDQREGPPGFWDDLSREERRLFVDLTIGETFRQMMRGFNEMEPEERREFVRRARRNIEERPRDRDAMERLEEEDSEMVERIVNEGLEAYYRDADSETKRDLAPLMEEIQRRMQQPDRRRRGSRRPKEDRSGEDRER